jgi:hypothetical protein
MFLILNVVLMSLHSDISCTIIPMWASMSPNVTGLQMAKTTFIHVRRH